MKDRASMTFGSQCNSYRQQFVYSPSFLRSTLRSTVFYIQLRICDQYRLAQIWYKRIQKRGILVTVTPPALYMMRIVPAHSIELTSRQSCRNWNYGQSNQAPFFKFQLLAHRLSRALCITILQLSKLEEPSICHVLIDYDRDILFSHYIQASTISLSDQSSLFVSSSVSTANHVQGNRKQLNSHRFTTSALESSHRSPYESTENHTWSFSYTQHKPRRRYL